MTRLGNLTGGAAYKPPFRGLWRGAPCTICDGYSPGLWEAEAVGSMPRRLPYRDSVTEIQTAVSKGGMERVLQEAWNVCCNLVNVPNPGYRNQNPVC